MWTRPRAWRARATTPTWWWGSVTSPLCTRGSRRPSARCGRSPSRPSSCPETTRPRARSAKVCDGWESAIVLHGQGTEIDGIGFFGLGAGGPVTPWDWSFDLTEEEAAQRLAECPKGCVLAVHSPPRGHVDTSSRGEHLGSVAVLDAIVTKQPRVALCGHIHESWGERSAIGPTEVINVGPSATTLDV